jgi:hypothetical protein
MQTAVLDERAAKAVATAAVVGDGKAAELHNCSKRSLRRWRETLEDDASLAAAVRTEKETLDADWAEDLTPAIRKAISFLGKAAEDCDTKDPAAVHSVAGALKILTDVATARRVLDARLTRQARKATEGPGPVATGNA